MIEHSPTASASSSGGDSGDNDGVIEGGRGRGGRWAAYDDKPRRVCNLRTYAFGKRMEKHDCHEKDSLSSVGA